MPVRVQVPPSVQSLTVKWGFLKENQRYIRRSGGIGRHVGLKIQWAVMPVRVQVPPSVQKP